MDRNQGGFTLMELMIAMVVMLIGIAGIMMMLRNSVVASRYTRHVTEATVLGEDKIEALRTVASATVTSGEDAVDALGYAVEQAPYTRTWNHVPAGDGTAELEVRVAWDEEGETRQVVLRTRR
jgi:prepilin-type N-terminal cleavage/methylation domain-containing protein